MNNSHSWSQLLFFIYMPSTHLVTILWITNVIWFRANLKKILGKFFKIGEFQFFWRIMTCTTFLTFFYFLTSPIMIIMILILTNFTVNTLISLQISMLSTFTASAWHFLNVRKSLSFCYITNYWLYPPVTFRSHVGFWIAVWIYCWVIRCLTWFSFYTRALSNRGRIWISINWA